MALRDRHDHHDLHPFELNDPRVVPNALPDDTEESIVGTEQHQESRDSVAVGLATVALRRGVAWGVCEEVGLRGLLHLDGRPYTPRPDTYVLRGPIDVNLAEVPLAEVGAPLLVVELGSESTVGNDLEDKRAAYEGAGAREYLVFDAERTWLETGAQGWRMGAGGRFEPWEPVRAGEWYSAELDLTLVVQGAFLRVRDRDGVLMPVAREAPLLWLEEMARREQAEEQVRQQVAVREQAEAQMRAETVAREQAQAQARQETTAREQAEAQARESMARLAEVEAELRRLRPRDPDPDPERTSGDEPTL